MHAGCRARPCRSDSRTARLYASPGCAQMKSVGTHAGPQSANTGRMVLPAAHLSYQHARNLPASRHAMRDLDWLADIFQAMSVALSYLQSLWSWTDLGGAPLSLAPTADQHPWGFLRCPTTDRRSAQSEGSISRQYLYILRMTPARTHKAHVILAVGTARSCLNALLNPLFLSVLLENFDSDASSPRCEDRCWPGVLIPK
jgi:hypothetical protein